MNTIHIALLMFLAVAYSDAETTLRTLVPADAESVATRELGGGMQLEFRLSRPRNQLGIEEGSLRRLRDSGWQWCAASPNAAWDEFSEDSGTRKVVQRVSYLRRGESMIAITERYVDKTGAPKDTRQVVLVKGDLAPGQIKEILESSRLLCE